MLFELTSLWHQQSRLTARKEALGKKRVHLNKISETTQYKGHIIQKSRCSLLWQGIQSNLVWSEQLVFASQHVVTQFGPWWDDDFRQTSHSNGAFIMCSQRSLLLYVRVLLYKVNFFLSRTVVNIVKILVHKLSFFSVPVICFHHYFFASPLLDFAFFSRQRRMVWT